MSLPQPLSSQGAYFTWKISHGTAPNKNVKKDTYDGLTVLEKLLKLILDVFILYDLDCTLHLSDLISNHSTLWQLNYVHLRCIFTVGSKQSHPSAAAPCARRLWLPSSANVVLCDHIMTSRITEERPSCHLTRDFLPMWFWCEGSLFFLRLAMTPPSQPHFLGLMKPYRHGVPSLGLRASKSAAFKALRSEVTYIHAAKAGVLNIGLALLLRM